ncbi:DUF2939 domain-containing protein [Prochlorococcus sp. MIT 0601]|uniref:DUF2939 domain-containing protein n=1 Tax=Prochlorococcus sp. MIT 0601 TaxID=1499498 RepID=UPI0005337428|nr:DUF2939 domain-containing protein [Prochlorococcus sp. MIT 0601]KGG12509.1 hypothetical protein EV05_1721 [Prochlorococcus sp. MIT 0601]
MRIRFYLVSLISIVFGGYLYATPYFSIISLKNAIEDKNSVVASRYINYKTVRESLKKEAKKVVIANLTSNSSSRKYSSLELILLEPIINNLTNILIESTVTPSGLNYLLNTGSLANSKSISGVNDLSYREDTNISQEPKPKTKENDIFLGYISINKFILKKDIESQRRTITTYWDRRRFINWRLSQIKIVPYP